ncbi:putative legume lectin domain, concanavalin A-like lectin/glucanase domain superfamily [Dioscorea sansibarensis]
MFNGTGRVHYSELIQLYKTSNNSTTKFTTYFQFSILFTNSNYNTSTGGFAFFLSLENSEVPINSISGYLGPFNEAIDGDPSNHMLAMEFDTYKNQSNPSNNHVGINVNSIVCKVSETWDNPMTNGDTLAATISYLETSKTFSVHLKDPLVPIDTGLLNLSYKVDLKEIFPDKVVVGFSASIGNAIVVQKITMWNFTLSLNDENDYENNVKSWHMGLAIAIGM